MDIKPPSSSNNKKPFLNSEVFKRLNAVSTNQSYSQYEKHLSKAKYKINLLTKTKLISKIITSAKDNRIFIALSRYLKQYTKVISNTSSVLRYIVIILALLFLSAIPWLSNLIPSVNAYNLSSSALAIINKPDKSLDSSTIFNNQKQSFTINPDGLKPSASAYPSYLVGQPSTGLYSATLPTNLDNGMAITNNSNHIGFTLKPQFNTSLGRHINGHFIYPLGTGAIQAVYTAKSSELSEDIVINKNVGNVLSFPYKLQLPSTFKAFNLAGGAIGIEGAGNISFQLSSPTITQSNNKKISQTNKNSPSAKLVLTKNNQLTLLATNLNKLSYPITIDPSVTINSTNNFLTGNDEGGNNITTNQVSTGAQTGGALNNTITTCPSGWTLNSATYCTNSTSLPAATDQATSVVYNGYVYEIGGYTTAATATVDYEYIDNGNVDPVSIILNGTDIGNPGIGGISNLSGIRVKYSGFTIACIAPSAPGYVNLIPPELGTPYSLKLTSDGCGHTYNLGTYVWVHIHLDDSQTATYPDINGNHTTITGFQIFYHPASINRLRGGATFNNGGSLQSLDAPPSTTQ